MQQSDKKYHLIIRLIKKEVFESLSPEEREQLDSWISASSANRDLYEKIRSGEAEKEYRERISTYDLESAWSNVFRMITRQKTRARSHRYLRAAAVVVILLGTSFLGVYLNSTFQQSKLEAFVDKVRPAESKAILYRDNEQISIVEDQRDTVLQMEDNLLFLNSQQISYYNPRPQPSTPAKMNTLVVPRGGYFKVVLSDSTTVWVNSESQLKFPEVFNSKHRRVSLEGEAFFEVTPGDRPFIVEFAGKELEVLGTSFNIKTRKDSPREYITLAHGLVQLNTAYQSLQLKPGQQAVVNPADQKIDLREVDPSLYTDWIRGKFVYRNAPLSQIIDDLERWYDVDIAFEEEAIGHLRFSLYMNRKEKISDILDILKETNRINYKLSKNQIVLTNK